VLPGHIALVPVDLQFEFALQVLPDVLERLLGGLASAEVDVAVIHVAREGGPSTLQLSVEVEVEVGQHGVAQRQQQRAALQRALTSQLQSRQHASDRLAGTGG
jgi:hypothetical protein